MNRLLKIIFLSTAIVLGCEKKREEQLIVVDSAHHSIQSTQQLQATVLTPDSIIRLISPFITFDESLVLTSFPKTFVSDTGSCVSGTFVEFRSRTDSESEVDFLFLIYDHGKWLEPYPISFDITERSDYTTVGLTDQYQLNDNCDVMTLRHYYEGGDLGSTSVEKFMFYEFVEVDGSAAFVEFFSFEARHVEKENHYENAGEEDTDSVPFEVTTKSITTEMEILAETIGGFKSFKLIETDDTDTTNVVVKGTMYRYNISTSSYVLIDQ